MNKQEKELLEKSVNPFTTDLTIPVRVFKTIKKIVDVQDIQEGIITTVPDQLVSKVLVEDAEYTRVYVRQGYRLHVMALPKEAKSVYLWLMYEIDTNLDYVFLNRRRYKEECGGTWTDLANGILQLTQSGIINNTPIKDVYWINPRFFFQGNRLKKYQDKLQERI